MELGEVGGTSTPAFDEAGVLTAVDMRRPGGVGCSKCQLISRWIKTRTYSADADLFAVGIFVGELEGQEDLRLLSGVG